MLAAAATGHLPFLQRHKHVYIISIRSNIKSVNSYSYIPMPWSPTKYSIGRYTSQLIPDSNAMHRRHPTMIRSKCLNILCSLLGLGFVIALDLNFIVEQLDDPISLECPFAM